MHPCISKFPQCRKSVRVCSFRIEFRGGITSIIRNERALKVSHGVCSREWRRARAAILSCRNKKSHGSETRLHRPSFSLGRYWVHAASSMITSLTIMMKLVASEQLSTQCMLTMRACKRIRLRSFDQLLRRAPPPHPTRSNSSSVPTWNVMSSSHVKSIAWSLDTSTIFDNLLVMFISMCLYRHHSNANVLWHLDGLTIFFFFFRFLKKLRSYVWVREQLFWWHTVVFKLVARSSSSTG